MGTLGKIIAMAAVAAGTVAASKMVIDFVKQSDKRERSLSGAFRFSKNKFNDNEADDILDTLANDIEDATDIVSDDAETVKQKIADAVESAKESAQDAADTFEDVIDDVKDKAEDIKEAAEDKLEEAKEALEDKAEEIKEAVKSDDSVLDGNDFADGLSEDDLDSLID